MPATDWKILLARNRISALPLSAIETSPEESSIACTHYGSSPSKRLALRDPGADELTLDRILPARPTTSISPACEPRFDK